jgi:PqqD family protein of HPr-rel-A system
MAGPVYIADAEGLRTVMLEGLTVLFHPHSGQTHIVAPPAPEILDALGEGEADLEGLVTRLRQRFEFDEADGRAAIAARLGELEAAGLVRRS